MSDGLRPGDPVLNLRAVTSSGGMFAGLLAAPVAAALSGWWWGWWFAAAVVSAVAGFAVAGMIGRLVFPAPPGQAVIVRGGPAALGIALRASVVGGALVSLACALAAFAGGGGAAAVIALATGVGASVGAGCLAALA